MTVTPTSSGLLKQPDKQELARFSWCKSDYAKKGIQPAVSVTRFCWKQRGSANEIGWRLRFSLAPLLPRAAKWPAFAARRVYSRIRA